MPEGRPAISAELKRSVLMETGYACAVPACRQATIELAHIRPWSEVRAHSFDNLIALCPNHHTRYDKGEIDRKAMHQYKANLAVLNGRYSDLERRVLQAFDDEDATSGEEVILPGGMDILMMHLIEDGIVDRHEYRGVSFKMGDKLIPAHIGYALTDKGREFITRWIEADPLLEG